MGPDERAGAAVLSSHLFFRFCFHRPWHSTDAAAAVRARLATAVFTTVPLLPDGPCKQQEAAAAAAAAGSSSSSSSSCSSSTAAAVANAATPARVAKRLLANRDGAVG